MAMSKRRNSDNPRWHHLIVILIETIHMLPKFQNGWCEPTTLRSNCENHAVTPLMCSHFCSWPPLFISPSKPWHASLVLLWSLALWLPWSHALCQVCRDLRLLPDNCPRARTGRMAEIDSVGGASSPSPRRRFKTRCGAKMKDQRGLQWLKWGFWMVKLGFATWLQIFNEILPDHHPPNHLKNYSQIPPPSNPVNSPISGHLLGSSRLRSCRPGAPAGAASDGRCGGGALRRPHGRLQPRLCCPTTAPGGCA